MKLAGFLHLIVTRTSQPAGIGPNSPSDDPRLIWESKIDVILSEMCESDMHRLA